MNMLQISPEREIWDFVDITPTGNFKIYQKDANFLYVPNKKCILTGFKIYRIRDLLHKNMPVDNTVHEERA